MAVLKRDPEIKLCGFELVSQNRRLVDMTRSVCMIQRERFDYTKWRQTLFAGTNGEEINRLTMALRMNSGIVEQRMKQK